MEKRMFNTKEAANYLGVNPHRIRELVHEDRIPFENISKGKNPSYRFDRVKLDEWLDNNPTY